jgi:SAM-dependent methyltransferase
VTSTSGRWNDPDRVEEFARRDPDHRLAELVKEIDSPASTRVLDLGCAGGRNAVFLLDRGFDVEALDAAPAMVERTGQDLVRASGNPDAARRVRLGRMDTLDFADDGRYALIVALGIYHQAEDEAALDRALAESSRGCSLPAPE